MDQKQVEGPNWSYISSEMSVVQNYLSRLAKQFRKERPLWDEDCSSPFIISLLMAQQEWLSEELWQLYRYMAEIDVVAGRAAKVQREIELPSGRKGLATWLIYNPPMADRRPDEHLLEVRETGDAVRDYTLAISSLRTRSPCHPLPRPQRRQAALPRLAPCDRSTTRFAPLLEQGCGENRAGREMRG